MDLTINSNFVIPSSELKWHFSRSSGPGGQSVNKTESRVELMFDINRSSVIGPFHKQRLLERLKKRCINGCLNIVVSEERSQYQNRQLALSRLADLLQEGLKPSPKARKGTKPTRASQKRRINTKKHRGALKQKRQSKPSSDD
ncbi:alternative ribosome rescue aminoacyl-tRNA hydrolase ArfB [Prochlorococcus sp. MIT 1300]|uniref:alternative ribosome rescue aminoacyl-tRNA hydrolase ArfB n=1 Tax=Prochlorococcus sp. MIT 1300 TaxID=3096218 RepID=UPI002A7563A1|nr:alternative ribosome rescue aminoacyl-tRNA hydrolase ArfB [Prochlorococcus sp. MIT 1300]